MVSLSNHEGVAREHGGSGISPDRVVRQAHHEVLEVVSARQSMPEGVEEGPGLTSADFADDGEDVGQGRDAAETAGFGGVVVEVEGPDVF